MSDVEPLDGTGSEPVAAESPEAAPSRGRRRTLARVATGMWVGFLVLALVGAVLYAFGGMWLRTPEMRDAHDALVTQGRARPVESRLVVPIPGCVCHSGDPVVQAEHSVRRINECGQCH